MEEEKNNNKEFYNEGSPTSIIEDDKLFSDVALEDTLDLEEDTNLEELPI